MKKRKVNNGIEIMWYQGMKPEKNKSSFLVNFVLEWVLISIVLYGAVIGLFVTCGAPILTRAGFWTMSLLAAVTMVVISLKKPVAIVIYLVVALVFFSMTYSTIIAGAKYFISCYLPFVNKYYKANFKITVSQDAGSVLPCLTYFQVFLGWILSILIYLARKIYKRPLVALISPTLFFSLTFIVGLVPGSKYLFAFLIGFLPLSLKAKGEDAAIGIQAKLTTLISMGILALVCMAVLPKAVYQDILPSIYSIKHDIHDIKNSDFMENILYNFTDMGIMSGGLFSVGSGGLDNGILGDKEKITYTGKTDFVLTTSLSAVNGSGNEYELFLRSYVGSAYSNKQWGDLNSEEKEAYEKLVEVCDYNFENQLTDFYRLSNILTYGDYSEPEMLFQLLTIDKKDIGKKHMLLPYGVKDDVWNKNGFLYTEDSYEKKSYTEELTANALFEPFKGVNSNDITQYLYKQELMHGLSNLKQEYQLEQNYIDAGMEEDGISVRGDTGEYGNMYSSMESLGGPLYILYGDFDGADSLIISEPKEEFQKFYHNEEKYRKYVYDTCTKVSENIAPNLQKEVSNLFLFEPDEYFKIDYVKDYNDFSNVQSVYRIMGTCQEFLSERAKYSLEPGIVPDDKDFIDYFLYESHEGYCTYFATAATMYLRLHGVPARYVEGYKVVSSDLVKAKDVRVGEKSAYQINVTDEMAHAWVEVYINGAGWIPFDPTPGRGRYVEETDNKGTSGDGTNVTSTPATSKEPVPSVKPSPSQSSQKPQVAANKEPAEKGNETKGFVHISLSIRIVLTVFLCILLILGNIMIRRTVILRRQAREERNRENNRRVKFYYREIDRIIRAFGRLQKTEELWDCVEVIANLSSVADEDRIREMFSIVEKAVFGAGQVSDYECMKVKVLYYDLRAEMYKNSSFIKRLYYKVWQIF